MPPSLSRASLRALALTLPLCACHWVLPHTPGARRDLLGSDLRGDARGDLARGDTSQDRGPVDRGSEARADVGNPPDGPASPNDLPREKPAAPDKALLPDKPVTLDKTAALDKPKPVGFDVTARDTVADAAAIHDGATCLTSFALWTVDKGCGGLACCYVCSAPTTTYSIQCNASACICTNGVDTKICSVTDCALAFQVNCCKNL